MRVTIVLVAPPERKISAQPPDYMKTMGFTDLRIVVDGGRTEATPPVGSHMDLEILLIILVFAPLPTRSTMCFTVATTARNRAKFHYYASPAELVPLLQENHAGCVMPRWFCA